MQFDSMGDTVQVHRVNQMQCVLLFRRHKNRVEIYHAIPNNRSCFETRLLFHRRVGLRQHYPRRAMGTRTTKAKVISDRSRAEGA